MRIFLPAALGALAMCAVVAPAWAEDVRVGGAYRVVVNPKSTVTSVERKFVADALLRKVTRWPDGPMIRPVDLSHASSVRHAFSEEILKRSVASVKSYWEQVIFSGRGIPPPEFDNDQSVIDYVLKHEGAIGYVSAAADVSAVKVVDVR